MIVAAAAVPNAFLALDLQAREQLFTQQQWRLGIALTLGNSEEDMS